MAWGYQAGGGIEVRLGAHWSVSGEYLFTSLNDRVDGTVDGLRARRQRPTLHPRERRRYPDLRREDRFEFEILRGGSLPLLIVVICEVTSN